MLSTGPKFGSLSQDCQGFQVLQLLQGHSMPIASLRTTPSLTAPRTHIPSQEYHQIGSGAISSAATTHEYSMIKGAFPLICVLTLKLLLVCLAWRKLLTISVMLACSIL